VRGRENPAMIDDDATADETECTEHAHVPRSRHQRRLSAITAIWQTLVRIDIRSHSDYWKQFQSDAYKYGTGRSTGICVPPTVDCLQCITSRYRLNTDGRRAFSVAGPTVWNSLPDFIRDPTVSADSFRRLLKTYLFARY